ncbi:uncharacterized protein LOC129858592 [Salvelinus fontinalis]|uniref:uncharacterized protein LOC129858592 n=1 Tax=Salvelinus fontinalis TaxID=8038 RepID=UPI002486CB9B|nr:uncharacterized protein LOC129858592 [Salvelinus fontinalis]
MEKRPIKFGIILTLAVSALLFFADVVPVARLRRATPSSSDKTTPATLSAYYLCVRITNQIYTESLNNQSSKEYKQLRKQVEQMMDDVHSALPESDKYMGVFDIIFSNGSVIANSTLMFGTTFMIIPTLVKGLLSTHIQSNKSKTLDLDLTYTEGKEDGNLIYFCCVAAWSTSNKSHTTSCSTYNSNRNFLTPIYHKYPCSNDYYSCLS